MRYCPKCSALQHDDKAAGCRRCGYVFEAGQESESLIQQKSDREELLSILGQTKSYDSSHPCPVCQEPTRALERDLEHKVEGEKIPLKGIRLMGGEITGKAMTLITIHVSGMECSSGHLICLSYQARDRPLCPLCQRAMINYGSSLFSCSNCKLHFPSNIFRSEEPERVLEMEGYRIQR